MAGSRRAYLFLLAFFSAFFAFVLLPVLLPSPIRSCFSSQSPIHNPPSRLDFPAGFVFGTASSAFQYEGATDMYGRGPSIWDSFSKAKGNILDGTTADKTCDQYHRYKEDVQLMAKAGFDSYRFSISWSRLFPEGKGQLNQLGVEYYNSLINSLLEAGLEPYVTLYHWDLPQALHDGYGGWLSHLIVNDFAAYADTCFSLFGDRVKHWITFNEPNIFIQMGYDLGLFAPRRCSSWIKNCTAGDSATEPYVAAHNVLLSHAAAVDNYRKNYQKEQAGNIGISVSVNWYVPYRNTTEDAKAAERMFDFQLGWFLDPIMHGDYPPIMRQLVGLRLPEFTIEEQHSLKGSSDFLGINHYTSTYVSAVNTPVDSAQTDYFRDTLTSLTSERDGVPIGPRAASEWLYIVPSGIYHVVKYAYQKYKLPIYITENGMDDADNGSLPMEEALQDKTRIHFHSDYLFNLASVVREGIDVRGYFAWSLLDNFEWVSGYTLRFGLFYVDYKTLKRHPKASARWFEKFLAMKRTDWQYVWWLPSCKT